MSLGTNFWSYIFNLAESHKHFILSREEGGGKKRKTSSPHGKKTKLSILWCIIEPTFPIFSSENHFKVITMVSVFCICWGPYALLSIIGIFRHSEVRVFVHFFLELPIWMILCRIFPFISPFSQFNLRKVQLLGILWFTSVWTKV